MSRKRARSCVSPLRRGTCRVLIRGFSVRLLNFGIVLSPEADVLARFGADRDEWSKQLTAAAVF